MCLGHVLIDDGYVQKKVGQAVRTAECCALQIAPTIRGLETKHGIVEWLVGFDTLKKLKLGTIQMFFY